MTTPLSAGKIRTAKAAISTIDCAMTALREDFLKRLNGNESLRITRDAFPELYNAYRVDGFDLMLNSDMSCGVWRRAGDALTIRFFAELIPEGMDSTDPELETGAIQRVIQTGANCAHHHWFVLPQGFRGRGSGRQTLRRTVDLYDALGLERVRLTAVEVGTYMWAMCGFDFASERERLTVLSAAEDFARQLGFGIDVSSIQYPWELDDLDEETSLRDIAAVRQEVIRGSPRIDAQLDEPIRLGKALLLHSDAGKGWSGILNLAHDSPGRIQLERYCGPRHEQADEDDRSQAPSKAQR